MREKARFVTLPALLLLIFFLGKLVMSFMGAPYELGVRVFSMVTLQMHLALIWGAFGRRYGYGVVGCAIAGAMIATASQTLIVVGTALSYPLGNTHFNDPVALGVDAPLGFAEAMANRANTFVGNVATAAIFGGVGWVLGALIPPRATAVDADPAT